MAIDRSASTGAATNTTTSTITITTTLLFLFLFNSPVTAVQLRQGSLNVDLWEMLQQT